MLFRSPENNSESKEVDIFDLGTQDDIFSFGDGNPFGDADDNAKDDDIFSNMFEDDEN